MTTPANSIHSDSRISEVLSANSDHNTLESNSQRKIAETLLKESETYSLDSNTKKEQANQYFIAADAMEKMAQAVRIKADQLRNKEIKQDEAVEEVMQIVGTILQIPVPKNATPELLDQIADSLERKAKENRMKADDLLQESEDYAKLSTQLKEQATMIVEKHISISDLRLQSAASHNEGLRMVFEKLGIYKVDAEYKEQVAYAERKAQQAQLGY